MLDPVQAWQLSVLINPSIQAGPPLPPFQLGIVFRVRLLEQAVLKQPEMWQLLGERLIPREVSLEALESWLALDDSNDHAAVPVWTMLLVITQHRLHANPGKNHLHCLRMGTQVAKPRTWDLRLPGSSKLCQVVRSALTLAGRKGRNADPGRFWS